MFGLLGALRGIIARVVQGVATGIAVTAMGAALVDLNPPENPGLAGIVSGLAPIGGLTIGALLAGALVEYLPWSTSLVYLLTLVGLLAAALVAWRMPETGVRRPGARASPRLRPAILALVPILIASWGLGGLYLSLGPSVAAEIFDLPSHVVVGLVAVFYVISYLAFSLPALAAGLASTEAGLRPTAIVYAAAALVLSLLAAWAQHRIALRQARIAPVRL